MININKLMEPTFYITFLHLYIKNVHLNARIIQNVSSTVLDGLWINYMTTASTNAHLRLYSGGSTTARMWIGADGKIGVNTVNPT